jgi:hypothetical protein
MTGEEFRELSKKQNAILERLLRDQTSFDQARAVILEKVTGEEFRKLSDTRKASLENLFKNNTVSDEFGKVFSKISLEYNVKQFTKQINVLEKIYTDSESTELLNNFRKIIKESVTSEELVKKMKERIINIEKTHVDFVSNEITNQLRMIYEKVTGEELRNKLREKILDAEKIYTDYESRAIIGSYKKIINKVPLNELEQKINKFTNDVEKIFKRRLGNKLIEAPRRQPVSIVTKVMLEHNSKQLTKQDPSRVLVSHPLDPDISFSKQALNAFGAIPSIPFLAMAVGVGAISEALRISVSSARKAFNPTSTAIDVEDARRGAMYKENGRLSTFFKIAQGTNSAKAVMGAAKAVGAISDALDFLAIFSIAGDAFFSNAFPDASQIVSDTKVNDIITGTVKAQLASFAIYNAHIRDRNQTCSTDTDIDCPYSYAQFPLIAGPLEELGMQANEGNGDAYYNQVKQTTMIDAIRENILRTDATFRQKLLNVLTSQDPTFDEIVASPTDSLHGYTTLLNRTDQDDLYETAYRQLCTRYGGTTYVDYYYMGPGADVCPYASNIATPFCQITSNRRRFQCGWSQTDCVKYSNSWSQRSWGHYAEWYNQNDINLYIGSPNDPSDPDITTGPHLYIHSVFKSGACFITSPGPRSFCNVHSGNYNPLTHRCTFTPEFCQSIGTCYCKGTQTCFLPNTVMDGMSFLFGQNGPREWIRVNGCVSSASTCGNETITDLQELNGNGGKKWFSDMMKNKSNFKEGWKQQVGTPMGALNFTGSILGIAMTLHAMYYTAAATLAAARAATNVAARAAITSLNVARGTSTAAAGIALEADIVAAQSEAVALTMARSAAGALGGPWAIAAAVAIGITMGIMAAVEASTVAIDQHCAPTMDGNEYTVGGWNIFEGKVSPKRMGFVDGWVTKPIKYHGVNITSINTPFATVNDFGYPKIEFWDRNTDLNAGGSQACFNKVRYCIATFHATWSISQNLCYQVFGTNKSPQPMGTYDPAYPPRMIRAATGGKADVAPSSRIEAGAIWCIPAFPINDGTQSGTLNTTGLFDAQIGVQAGGVTPYLTSNT